VAAIHNPYYHYFKKKKRSIEMNLKRCILFIAAPGSGKSTISKRIEHKYKLAHVSSGNLFRAQISAKTDLGRQVEKIMNTGMLVQDDLTMRVLRDSLSQMSLAKYNGVLLDGIPRTLNQVELFEKEFESTPDLVINLDVPFSEIVGRLSNRLTHLPSGRVYNLDFDPPKVPGVDDVTGEKLVLRADDKPEAVSSRLENYELITRPILQYYDKKDLVRTFKGTETNVIWPVMDQYLEKHFT